MEMFLFIIGQLDFGNDLSFAIYSDFMKLRLQEHSDTGLEYLTDDIRIRGRILNGVANIVFEGVEVNGIEEQESLIFTLPQKYVPKQQLFFNLYTNEVKPSVFFCKINGNRVSCLVPKNRNIVGSVSYLI